MKVAQIAADNLIDFSIFFGKDGGTPQIHAGVKELKGVDGARLRQGTIIEIVPPYLGTRIRIFSEAAKKSPKGKFFVSGKLIME